MIHHTSASSKYEIFVPGCYLVDSRGKLCFHSGNELATSSFVRENVKMILQKDPKASFSVKAEVCQQPKPTDLSFPSIQQIDRFMQSRFETLTQGLGVVEMSKNAARKILSAVAVWRSLSPKDILYANLGLVSVVHFVTRNETTAAISGLAFLILSAVVCLGKKTTPSEIPSEESIPEQKFPKHKKKYHSEKDPADEDFSTDLAPEIDDLTALQEREIDQIITLAGLDPELIKPSLDELKKATLFNLDYPRPFDAFKERVRAFTAHYAYGDQGNIFTGK